MVYVYTQNGNPARHGHVDPFAWIPIKLDTPQHETWLTRTPPDHTPPDEGPNKAKQLYAHPMQAAMVTLASQLRFHVRCSQL
mmetsp:Transcript_42536/g.96122  ORF Transcript_42536/g.96122 Transcript_42536/m.96122 type:complete len:82 (+) Transcript_42536:578-823(+)